MFLVQGVHIRSAADIQTPRDVTHTRYAAFSVHYTKFNFLGPDVSAS
jgi:hypothetical protein